jgi:hypothetical protein
MDQRQAPVAAVAMADQNTSPPISTPGSAPLSFGLLLSGAGVVTLVTGVFGYCPACAVAGREPLKG